MSWAGKAAEAAWQVLGYGRGFSEGERRSGFNTGARWQRDQLRTDEAVERAKAAILAEYQAVEEEKDFGRKTKLTEFQRWVAGRYARAAITALLGEDT